MAQFQIPFPNDGAPSRLVIFHHAGGSSLGFAKPARALAGPHEVLLAELPGRATRHQEKAGAPLTELAHDFARELALSPKPTLLYGHSLGGLIAFETALALEAAGKAPERVVISCVRAPHLAHGPSPLRDVPAEKWTDDLVLDSMRVYGELPPALATAAAREYFLPLFRQDFALVVGYRASRAKLQAPLLAIAGAEDPAMRPAEVDAWREYTNGVFRLQLESGGHFCVLDRPEILQGVFGS